MPNSIIVSISSDIGDAMAARWLARKWNVAGTYRTRSASLDALEKNGATLVACDLGDASSVSEAAATLIAKAPNWDVLAILAGTMEPIGPFAEVNFDAWAQSIEANFTNQLRILHALLPVRARQSSPLVLYFAGGGTNGAPVNFSAYTVSKIALIKMCELLDAEMPDVRFAIVGPGWVRTKIHEETLRAEDRAGDGHARTLAMLRDGNFTPMEDVLDCCDWLVAAPKNAVSGRNFSVVYDSWGDENLEKLLRDDPQMYKLRRAGNESGKRYGAMGRGDAK